MINRQSFLLSRLSIKMHHKSSPIFIELKTSHTMNNLPCGNQPQRVWPNHWINSLKCRSRIKWESNLGPTSRYSISLWWRMTGTNDINHNWIQRGPIITEMPQMTNRINLGKMFPSSTRLTQMRKSTWALAPTRARTLSATGASTGGSVSETWATLECVCKSALWMPNWKRSNNLRGSSQPSPSTNTRASCDISKLLETNLPQDPQILNLWRERRALKPERSPSPPILAPCRATPRWRPSNLLIWGRTWIRVKPAKDPSILSLLPIKARIKDKTNTSLIRTLKSTSPSEIPKT